MEFSIIEKSLPQIAGLGIKTISQFPWISDNIEFMHALSCLLMRFRVTAFPSDFPAIMPTLDILISFESTINTINGWE